MTKCVIYAAKSSIDEGGSLPDQERHCRTRINALGDREVVAVHRDENASGWSGDRGPGLASAMQLAKDLAAEYPAVELWVFHSSRLGRGSGLARQARSLLEVFVELRRAGVTIRSVEDDQLVTHEMFIGFASAQAHEYAKSLSSHTRRGVRRKVQDGRWGGGRVPDGFWPRRVMDGKKARTVLDVDPERTPVVQQVIALGLQGLGGGQVARLLNSQGVRASMVLNDIEGNPRRDLSYWTGRRVRQLWSVPLYTGLQWLPQEDGDPVLVECDDVPRLIERDDWQRLQRLIAGRREQYEQRALRTDRDGRFAKLPAQERHPGRVQRGQRPSRLHLLSGLLVCARCGAPINAFSNWRNRHPNLTGRRYQCGNSRDANSACTAPRVDAELVERPFVEHLSSLAIDVTGWLHARATDREAQREQLVAMVEQATMAVENIDRRVEAVRADYAKRLADGDDKATDLALATLADLDAERQRAEHRLAEQRAVLADLPSEPDVTDVEAFVDALRSVLAEGVKTESITEANAQLRAAIDHVAMDVRDDGSIELTAYMDDLFVQKWADGDPDQVAVASFLARPDGMALPGAGDSPLLAPSPS